MTSIIVTVGPSSIAPSMLKKLKLCGAERFRINLSHATHSSLKEYIEIIKSVGITPSIDTQGAQLRIKCTSLVGSIQAENIVNLYFTDEYKNINHRIINHRVRFFCEPIYMIDFFLKLCRTLLISISEIFIGLFLMYRIYLFH